MSSDQLELALSMLLKLLVGGQRVITTCPNLSLDLTIKQVYTSTQRARRAPLVHLVSTHDSFGIEEEHTIDVPREKLAAARLVRAGTATWRLMLDQT